MRRFIRRNRYHSPIGFIILPMIDVIFLLLLFFVIMTSFEAGAKISVQLPEPDHSQAKRDLSSKQVVINCETEIPESVEPGNAIYRIAADEPQPLSAIAARLASAKQANPQLTVVIRADKRLAFAQVKAVMQVVAEAGVPIMNVSAIRDVE
jgi:biopolymer transport protein ExbD